MEQYIYFFQYSFFVWLYILSQICGLNCLMIVCPHVFVLHLVSQWYMYMYNVAWKDALQLE